MRFLADVEQPPRSRLPGLIVGFVVAIPLVGMVVGWLVPAAIGAILGGAQELDARLRATDAYLTELCSGAMEPGRDEELCGCVLAVEFPSLDCRAAFNEWAIAQQSAACTVEETRQASLSYCTCVETVAERTAAIEDAGERRREAATYENCESLEDAVPLPPVETEAEDGAS